MESQSEFTNVVGESSSFVVEAVLTSLQPLQDLAKNWDIDVSSWCVVVSGATNELFVLTMIQLLRWNFSQATYPLFFVISHELLLTFLCWVPTKSFG